MKRVIPLILYMLASAALSAQTSVFVTVTNHNEEALNWCGAATGQMAVSGYPAGACNVVQADMWDAIQNHHVEAGWDTDPKGLKDGMMAICAGAHWVDFSNVSATSLMYSAAYWMNRLHYPVPVLLSTSPHNSVASHREHWVLIKGIVTDNNPITTSSVTLQYVLLVDPSPANFGDPPVERFISGSQFYSEFQAVAKPGSAYDGKYVAIIEPPERSGTATAVKLPITGRLLAADQILSRAQREVATAAKYVSSLREYGPLQPMRPQLVNGGRDGAYYIVRFAERDKPPTLSVVLNAYSGQLMEVVKHAPRQFLDERQVLENARGFLRNVRTDNLKATLVAPEGSAPCEPVWRVTADDVDLLIDPNGRVRRVPRRPIP